MSSIKLIGGGIILGCALLSDAHKTIQYTTTTIAIFGAKFIAEKITATMNKNSSQLINVTGWSLMAVPLVGIIKLSLGGVYCINDSVQKTKDTFTSIGTWMENITDNINPLHWFN